MVPRCGWLALLLAAATSAEAAVAVRGLGARGASAVAGRSRRHGRGHRQEAGDEQPTCSCDCCDVRQRRPDESIGVARVKCTPADGHSADMCGLQCTPAREDVVLAAVASDDVLDYSRFCFFECKPALGLDSPPATQCVALEESDVKRVVDVQGNAMDPAIVYGRPGQRAAAAVVHEAVRAPAASLVSRRSSMSPEAQAALDATAKGTKQAQTEERGARDWANSVRTLEEQQQRQLASQLRGGSLGALDPYAVVADLHDAAQRGMASAQRAAEAAQEAVLAYKEARSVNWRAGLSAAEGEVMHMKREAEEKAYAEAHPPPSWTGRAAAAAAKADGPYLDTVRSGEESAAQWSALASQTTSQAKALDAQARSLAAEADALARAGEAAAAHEKLAESRAAAAKAQEFSDGARKMLGTARAASASAKLYYSIAGEAAARAAANVPVS